MGYIFFFLRCLNEYCKFGFFETQSGDFAAGVGGHGVCADIVDYQSQFAQVHRFKRQASGYLFDVGVVGGT